MELETAALTLITLAAFASNSLLTRLALSTHAIDAAAFTVVRLGAGAIALALMVRARWGTWAPVKLQGASRPLLLFVYAVPFSFAYLRIGAAVGALVLFGAVQLTMVGYGMITGERPSALAWLGLVLASAGLGSLTMPSAAAPDTTGLLLMAAAGVAWGAYSLAGRSTPDPIAANARCFVWSFPLALLVALVVPGHRVLTPSGVALAAVSGAITSGFGYVAWYRAVRRMSVTQAAVAQLSVPVLAALGAVAFLGERMSTRLALSGSATLCGVGLVLAAHQLRRR
jgi:drug/metabolite transporter (DMT)-like permease